MHSLLRLFTLATSLLFLCHTTIPMSIDGFLGAPPAKIFWIINKLNEATWSGDKLGLKNRLILHGPPGNGKSLLARKIADLTDRLFFQIDGPNIINKFQGSGAEKIAQAFKDALIEIEMNNEKILMFIDEIDAIACNNDETSRADHKAALQQLWLEMDKYKHDPRIFIVCATNHFNKLDTTFLDRFGNNIIELKNPDAATRKLIIAHYFKQYDIILDSTTFSELVTQTNGLSIRSIEDLASDVHIEAEVQNKGIVSRNILFTTLKKIHKKFADNTNNDAALKTKLERASLYVTIVGGSLLATVNSIQISSMVYAWLYPEKTVTFKL